MLIVKSAHSLSSQAIDRLAIHAPGDLPKLIKAQGWPHAVLADERTMAGALDFLDYAKKEGLTASAGLQVSGIATPSGETAFIFVPLNQGGLNRLIGCAHLLATAVRIEDIAAAIEQPAPRAASPDIAVFILPGRDFTPAAASLFEIYLTDRDLGLAFGLVDVNGEDLYDAPQSVAADAATYANKAVAALSFGYTEKPFDQAFLTALISETKDADDQRRRSRTRNAEPQVFDNPTIPAYRAPDESNPAERNAQKILARFQKMSLTRTPTLPARAGLQEGDDANAILLELAAQGYNARVKAGHLDDTQEARDRLERETKLIVKLGFSNYFLIMREVIGYARKKGIPVGPGRGSAAGSIAAFVLGITNIDPIKHKLLFERFINPERVSLPDIDTDFCEQRRGEVLDHVADFYGESCVAQIATYAHLKVKGAIRAAARALNLRGAAESAIDFINQSGRPDEEFVSILADNHDPEIQQITALAAKLYGISGHAGIHAGGIIISDEPITNAAPILATRSDSGRQVIAFDMKGTEKSGLVKFDFLGLKTLTVIQRALDTIKAATGKTIDLDALPDSDEAVFSMIRRGETRTIFQLESAGITRAATEIGVDNFEDIVALVALYRPGPMDNIQIYSARKRGRSPVAYPHPALEDILKDTYGIMIYQEQIIAIAQVLAGYTAGQADLLRRAIGKKIPKELEEQRVNFVSGSVANGVEEDNAREIFDLIYKFANYGFNRSHAVAYATITWQTAWLKYHHPAAWYAAAATFEADSEDRAHIIAEAARRGIKIYDPDINSAQSGFYAELTPGTPGAIRLPLECIKNVGANAAATAIAERKARGPFKSFRDLVSRCNAFNRAQLEALAFAGALDRLSGYPPTIARAQFAHMARNEAISIGRRETSQLGLFGAAEMPDLKDPEPSVPALTPDDAATKQREYLQGLMFHEKRQFAAIAWRREIEQLPNLERAENITKKMACATIGLLAEVGEKMLPTREGTTKRVITLTLEDETSKRTFDIDASCALPPDLFNAQNSAIKLNLSPPEGNQFIVSRPTITRLEILRDPTQPPYTYPVAKIDREFDEKTKAGLLAILRTTTRDAKADVRSNHILVVSPSRAITPLPLPARSNLPKLAEKFRQVPGFLQLLY